MAKLVNGKARAKVYGLVIILGAFLLFQIEPMVGKAILPFFGGSSQVWSAALLFFMLLLFAGYLYASMLSKLRPLLQTAVHLLVVASSVAVVISPKLLPDAGLVERFAFLSPSFQVLAVLFVSIGLPFFLLATTSVLLQDWFGKMNENKSPYGFYALSNLGSLAALISYPLVIEPQTSLSVQGVAWRAGFLIFTGGLVICTIWFTPSSQRAGENSGGGSHPRWRDRAVWLLLSTLSSVILLSSTNEITQGVAPVPFLWLLSLSLYLVSFILTFSEMEFYSRPWYSILAVLAVFLALGGVSLSANFSIQIIIYGSLVFTGCMICHGELYRARPSAPFLTAFYTMIALGGVIGGVFVVLLAPVWFRAFWEFPLALLSLLILALAVLQRSLPGWFSKTRFRITSAIILVQFALLAFGIAESDWRALTLSRNFYGLLRVGKFADENGQEYLALTNGKIVHGAQFQAADLSKLATTYYGQSSGIGQAIENHPRRTGGKTLRVGIVGLGIGTLAVYCKTGDDFRFYEINPDVVVVARDWFRYLSLCPQAEIAVGDARLVMQKELERGGARRFDILVVDAFTDDSIPVHLLTKEALEIYLQHLAPDGILAFHISNRYLNLEPVLGGLAEHFGLAGQVALSDYIRGELVYPAHWVILSGSPVSLTSSRDLAAQSKKPRLWTDDFSNLLQVVR